MELQKVVATFGERVGSPGGGSRRSQSRAVIRAAEAVPAPEGVGEGGAARGAAQASGAKGDATAGAAQPSGAEAEATRGAPAETTGAPPEPAPDPPPSAIRPRARRPAPSPKRAAAREAAGRRTPRGASNGSPSDAPVDHYDDLEAGEIVTLLDSLEDGDLAALLEYEQANRGRRRIVSAIERTRARREAGQRG
jgi:hypothetical protein